ncbi:alpha/beta fold hydrolase [Aureimonas jatrophae]|uniref:Lysophospholipase, alpha-beta hydrolase superfamily n=1 Tax=Aureimonas jatrophae TaxID=1166073 RepID=A0A1H0CBC5_9HYPH|nr:alpha/beta hydrolase [Aureimonas jatrophae]MBB3949158.1 alpha-beta hydrolase superfamily lysophospholipase [Aureimonas jatrophae]SDN55188.1 Lysophospholipase, alpha-beta hydrolase superfamily [Aureimonas jatrophae]
MSHDRPALPDASVLDSLTGAALRLYRSRPAGRPRLVLLILHGLAEHAGRYARVMEELAAHGVASYAHDQRGHGSTTAQDAPLRRFASRHGASKIVRDTQAVRLRAEADHPGIPIVVLGHSMGGLVALNFARTFGSGLAGLLVWNSNFDTGPSVAAGRLALRTERALKGSDVASAVFARATFESWAKSVPGARTPVDWLTHDATVVDRYIADPLCGWTPTVSMAEDVIELIRAASRETNLADLPRELPIHCLGGSEDPATRGGAAVERLAERLRHAGSRRVETLIVRGARHETLNETEPMRGRAIAALHAFLASVSAD